MDRWPMVEAIPLEYGGAMRSARLSRGAAVLLLVVALFAASTFRVMAQDDGQEGPERSAVLAARALLVEVDRTELCYWERHGRYSDSVAELQRNAAKVKGAGVPGSSIAFQLTEGHFNLTLDAGADGRSYIQRITGNGVDTYLERRGAEFADYGDLAWGHVKERCTP